MNSFFQHHPLPTFLYDLHSFAILVVNEAALYQYGYSEHEFLSFTLAQLAVPASEAHVRAVPRRRLESIGGARYTCTHRRKDGTLFDAEVVSRLIQWDSRWLGLAAAVDITAEVSAGRSLERRIDDRTAALISGQEELRACLLSMAHAEQRERQQLARMLHDHVAQDIAIAKLRLEWLSTKDASVHPLLTEIQTVLAEALACTRRLIYDMVPATLDDPEDLFMAMEAIIERMKRRGLRVVLKDDGKPKSLPGPVLSLIMESIQELLFNVRKHAKVDQALVQIRIIGKKLHISVVDTGVGFSSHQLERDAEGIGLVMIRERLVAVGGQLQVTSAPRQGTCIRISVPLNPDTDAKRYPSRSKGKVRPRRNRSTEDPSYGGGK